MVARAAHVVDAVLPDVPVRQWVLTLPLRLRNRLAWDHDLCRAVGIFVRAFSRRCATAQPGTAWYCLLGCHDRARSVPGPPSISGTARRGTQAWRSSQRLMVSSPIGCLSGLAALRGIVTR
jgi:hypothetical protein